MPQIIMQGRMQLCSYSGRCRTLAIWLRCDFVQMCLMFGHLPQQQAWLMLCLC